MEKHIMLCFGTRPEAIKLASLALALKAVPNIRTSICTTGQHREMLDQVMRLFRLRADVDLNLMKPGQDLTDITCRVLTGLRGILHEYRPDWLVVQGDTTTAFAGALAAFYEKISVAHVEAGLRTGNIHAPWPEEMNRRLVGSLAQIHFAPTKAARQNLLAEGVTGNRIFVTGNTVIDALFDIIGRIRNQSLLGQELAEQFPFLQTGRRLILVTGHRRENFGPAFEKICHGLKKLAEREDVILVYPVHLNPKVRGPVHRILGDLARVHLLPPLEYMPFAYLMNRSYFIITDSGGIQEEAPSLGKPVLVTRETTERPEAVEAGTVRLVGSSCEALLQEANRLLDDPAAYQAMARAHNPYGDGLASKRILKHLRSTDPRGF